MTKFCFTAAMILAGVCAFAQEPALKPFYHGVASGDALSDRVILWTRVTPDVSGALSVDWLIATDTLFTNIVNSGTATTDSTKDYTVKVDATGLQPDTWYYYIFRYEGKNSLIGRTKTLPTGNNARIRMAVVSCASMGAGNYFNAYLGIARRNDIQAVIHLGDYIYEYAAGTALGTGVTIQPNHEITTLADYRQRYNTFHLDPYLRRLHQQYPFYTTWDDHETANNSWWGGAENHSPGSEGDWQQRKAWAKQANFEWLPKREQAPGDYTIYRTFHIGDLADLILLDTRLEARSEQVGVTDVSGLQDTNRTLLGTTQMQWFKNELSHSTARWKIVGQQVMIAPLKVFGVILNADQWDGYQADRNRVINHVLNNNIENVVFLTGDIHSSWASDVPGPNYNSSTGSGSAFVEYVCTSITSSGSPFAVDPKPFNPHIKYAELTKRGYLILDIDSAHAQGDWVYVSTISDAAFTENNAASWYVNENERFLHEAAGAATDYTNPAPFAPLQLDTTNVLVQQLENQLDVTVFPNPFENKIYVQMHGNPESPVMVRLFDTQGKMVSQTAPEQSGAFHLITGSLPAGSYLLTVECGNKYSRFRVWKAQ